MTRDIDGKPALPPDRAPRATPPRHRVFVIGLDGYDPDLLRRWSQEGRLPFLRSLMAAGTYTRLTSTRGLFSDSPWPTFATGVSPATHGYYNHLQLARGTTRIERLHPARCARLPFWSLLRGPGKTAVIFDAPKTYPLPGVAGAQICAWGEHYPLLKAPASEPSDLIREVIARFGTYRHATETTGARSLGRERRLYRRLLANVETKLRATDYLMTRTDWDLFLAVFSEAHDAGHQFYHRWNPDHWAYDRNGPADLREALPRVYADLDAALASLFARVPGDATFLIVSVHGMATNHSATHLVPEILERLGYLAPASRAVPPTGVGAWLGRTRSLRNLIPTRLRDLINTSLVPQRVHDEALAAEFAARHDWTRTTAFLLESDHFQAFLSINLAGREPFGVVRPGQDCEALCLEIAREFKRLINPDTGKPAVRDVVRPSEAYRGPNLHVLPDLVVQWSDDAPIRRVFHPRLGLLSDRGFKLRTAQHGPDGFLIAGGAHVKRGAPLVGADTLDLAPTILYLLSESIPDDMDGRVLFGLFDDDFAQRHRPTYESRPALVPQAAAEG